MIKKGKEKDNYIQDHMIGFMVKKGILFFSRIPYAKFIVDEIHDNRQKLKENVIYKTDEMYGIGDFLGEMVDGEFKNTANDYDFDI